MISANYFILFLLLSSCVEEIIQVYYKSSLSQLKLLSITIILHSSIVLVFRVLPEAHSHRL